MLGVRDVFVNGKQALKDGGSGTDGAQIAKIEQALSEAEAAVKTDNKVQIEAKYQALSGRLDEAIREMWAAQRVSPMNLELPEELIPDLQQANRHVEAEDLFQRIYSAMRQQCLDFPNCATLHNNLAWLFARNGRELDEAFQHAERALVLDPDNPAYIDTLGEVHFRRGKFDDAIVCAERCLKIESRSKHYQEQLARFRQAKEGGK